MSGVFKRVSESILESQEFSGDGRSQRCPRGLQRCFMGSRRASVLFQEGFGDVLKDLRGFQWVSEGYRGV